MTADAVGLQRAIDYLEAVEVATARVAWRLNPASDQRAWLSAKTEDLASCVWVTLLGEMHLEWPNGNDRSVIMPSWWTPDRRFAVRYGVSFAGPYGSLLEATQHLGSGGVIVTADLETGAEVPA